MQRNAANVTVFVLMILLQATRSENRPNTDLTGPPTAVLLTKPSNYWSRVSKSTLYMHTEALSHVQHQTASRYAIVKLHKLQDVTSCRSPAGTSQDVQRLVTPIPSNSTSSLTLLAVIYSMTISAWHAKALPNQSLRA